MPNSGSNNKMFCKFDFSEIKINYTFRAIILIISQLCVLVIYTCASQKSTSDFSFSGSLLREVNRVLAKLLMTFLF